MTVWFEEDNQNALKRAAEASVQMKQSKNSQQNKGSKSLGVIAGILGCILGIIGIFAFSIIFVPLAAICAVIGLIRGIYGNSVAGIGTSLLASVLTVIGYVTSPTLLFLTAMTMVISNIPHRQDVPSQPSPKPAQSMPSSQLDNQPIPAVPTAIPPIRNPASDHATRAFVQGQADRRAWEEWFSSLNGEFRSGAYYWSGQRSVLNPGSCSASPPSTGQEWTAGCHAAQDRLTAADVRRKGDSAYRSGWNNPDPDAVFTGTSSFR